jgi:hypothetical protein
VVALHSTMVAVVAVLLLVGAVFIASQTEHSFGRKPLYLSALLAVVVALLLYSHAYVVLMT